MEELAVKQIMSTNLVSVSPDDTVYFAYMLLKRHKVRQLPVCVEGRLVGIITDRDIRQIIGVDSDSQDFAIPNTQFDKRVSDYMTRNPITISPETPIEKAVQIINTKKYGSIPVCTSDNTIVGIVTITDISGLLLKLLKK